MSGGVKRLLMLQGLDLHLDSVRTTVSERFVDNIYMQEEFETGLATMCLERGREEALLLFFFST